MSTETGTYTLHYPSKEQVAAHLAPCLRMRELPILEAKIIEAVANHFANSEKDLRDVEQEISHSLQDLQKHLLIPEAILHKLTLKLGLALKDAQWQKKSLILSNL